MASGTPHLPTELIRSIATCRLDSPASMDSVKKCGKLYSSSPLHPRSTSCAIRSLKFAHCSQPPEPVLSGDVRSKDEDYLHSAGLGRHPRSGTRSIFEFVLNHINYSFWLFINSTDYCELFVYFGSSKFNFIVLIFVGSKHSILVIID